MTEAVTITITGIKCDNPDCDYRDNTVTSESYLEYIGKPCPECDSVLLTQEDYDSVMMLQGTVIDINKLIPANLLGDEETFLDIEMQGDGSMVITEKVD